MKPVAGARRSFRLRTRITKTETGCWDFLAYAFALRATAAAKESP